MNFWIVKARNLVNRPSVIINDKMMSTMGRTMKARIRVPPFLLDCSRRTAAYTRARNSKTPSGTRMFTTPSFSRRVSQARYDVW